MKNDLKIQAIDFFCSAGGVTCGFKQSGIDVIGGIDIDSSCKDTYEKNNKSTILNADISELSFKQFDSTFQINRNQDNLVFIGCSPCQYYSNIKTDKNKSKGTKLLLDDFQRFVDYYKPGYIFIENVPGFMNKSESPIDRFKKFLDLNGYKYIDAVLNAKDYSVPQNRRRYILIATRLKKKIALPEKDSKVLTVRNAIGDYQEYKPIPAGYSDKSTFLHTTSCLTDKNLQRIKSTPHDGGDRKSWESDKTIQLNCYKAHKGHYDVYGRMFWDKPAPTITTRFNSYSNGRYGHPEQDRAISLREGATLQTFPKDYIFHSKSNVTISRMIGNAVPPRFAEKIADSLLNSILERENEVK